MREKYKSIFDSIFSGIPDSFGDVEDFMWEVVGVVPNSQYFYRIINRNNPYEKLVLDLKKIALTWSKKGLSIYLLTDDPCIVHALALNKKYLPYVKLLKKKSNNNIMMIDEVFPSDI